MIGVNLRTLNGASAASRQTTRVRRTCLTARRCKFSTQPDGGEGLAKRKGFAVRRGLKEAWSKCTIETFKSR